MKPLLSLLIILFTGSLLHTPVAAQTVTPVPSPAASAQQTISFPIPELGNCQNKRECYLYCQIPENKSACWSYGKFVMKNAKPDPKVTKIPDILSSKGITFPVTELGNCADPAACKAYCTQPLNHVSCRTYAQSKGLQLREAQKKEQQQQKAQTSLGCTSDAECRQKCQNNPDECRKKLQNLKRLRITPESRATLSPRACKDSESCKKYCLDYPEECPGPRTSESKPQSLLGPRGCRTETECDAYCNAFPTSCPGYPGSAGFSQNDIPAIAGVTTVATPWCERTPGCTLYNGLCECNTSATTPPQPNIVPIAP